MIQHPRRGGRKAVAPLQRANNLLPLTGGLRFASTTGYFLTTLRVVGLHAGGRIPKLQSRLVHSPAGCPLERGNRHHARNRSKRVATIITNPIINIRTTPYAAAVPKLKSRSSDAIAIEIG